MIPPPRVFKHGGERIIPKRGNMNAYGGAGGGGGGAGGGSYSSGYFSNLGGNYGSNYSSIPYYQATAMSMPTYYPPTGSGAYISPEEAEESRQLEKEIKKKRKPLKLENMPDWKKERMKEILNKFIKEYKFQKGVEDMTKGVKWLLIFLGLAILWNFGTILQIIATAVGAN